MFNLSGNVKKLILAGILLYCFSTCFFAIGIIRGEDSLWSEGFSGDTLGRLSVALVYPVADISLEESEAAPEEVMPEPKEEKNVAIKKDPPVKKVKAIPNDKNPQVLIYHTHATESYLPAKSGNYHTTKEENTVRDVGSVMMKYLKKEGIRVYHNKTLHDNPSYNASYDRSYETIEKIIADNPSIECVIDLHRDAIPSSSEARTININGNECACYSFVIGQGAPNFRANTSFVNRLNEKARSLYGSMRGEVIARGYIYNQNLHDKSILLEVGNNRNSIGEARNTARYLAKVIASALK